MLRILLIFILANLPTLCLATPKTIIIIRHADKLEQGESGPALSATGLARSIQFAFYFLDKFGAPDYMIAADDKKENGHEIAIRSIQTLAPLANMMQERLPEYDYPILHPYASDNYQLLADYILTASKFNNKLVLICWSHQRIAPLAHALGVTENIPTWPRQDYDTVYELKYEGRNLISFDILQKQFEVKRIEWRDLIKQTSLRARCHPERSEGSPA